MSMVRSCLTFNTFYGTIMLVKRGLGMNVFSIVRNLFKKKETGITKIGDNVNVRSRSDLSDFDVQKLDVFKKEYLDKLRNRILFSGDLDENEFKTTMDMYIELVLNLFLKEFSEFESIEEYSEQLYLVLKSKKLGLYLHDILGVINEIELRIIALDEILSEVNSFNVSKRRAINNKLENMLLLFHTFQVQREAIFRDAVSNIKLASTQNEILDEKMVLEKRDRLFKMFSIMLSNRIPYFRSDNFESVLDEVAYLERELEIGVFKRKDVIKFIEDTINTCSLNSVTLKDIEELELRIRVFSDYGRDLVSGELLDKLYKIKFDVVTRDIVKSYDENYFKNLSFIEIDKYKEIIFSKINDITMGNNEVLTKAFGKDYGYYARIIVDVLKDGDVQFDFYKILTSKFLLSFLVSLDSAKGILDFFRYTKDKKSNYSKYYFDQPEFVWEEEIPYESIFDIAGDCDSNMYKLYKKLFVPVRQRLDDEYCYRLPEGIVEINVVQNVEHSLLLERIRTLSDSKDIIMPSTLKSIKGDVFGGHQFRSVHFNEGLEIIQHFPACDYKRMDTLNVPSTLVDIIYKRKSLRDSSSYIFEIEEEKKNLKSLNFRNFTTGYERIKTLIFENFDFNNPSDNVLYLLGIFFGVSFEKCNSSNYVNLSNNVDNLRYLKTNLECIVFKGKNGESLTVYTERLRNLVISDKGLFMPDELTNFELKNLLEYLLTGNLVRIDDEQKTLRL